MDFALAVWKEEPAAGELSNQTGKHLEPSKVTQIFNTTVYGGSANLVGAATESSITFNIARNDFSSLEQILRDNGVSNEDIADLQQAVENDSQPTNEGKLGPRVSSWIGGMVKKAADGSWGVGVSAAGNLLARAIAKYSDCLQPPLLRRSGFRQQLMPSVRLPA